MTENSRGRIQILNSIHGVDLTGYFKVLSEISRFGTSASIHILPGTYREVDRSLRSLSPSQRWDVYTTVITGAAGIYLSAKGKKKAALLPAYRYMTLKEINEADLRQEVHPDSVINTADIRSNPLSPSAPKVIKVIDNDLSVMVKALKKGKSELPELSLSDASETLSPEDVSALMAAAVSYLKASSR